MATPTFQNLPLHIAERIAYYCISSRLEPNNMFRFCIIQDRVWSLFYNVCRYWRELALKHFFSHAVLDVFTEDGSTKLEYVCLPNNVKIDREYKSYVKGVTLFFGSKFFRRNDSFGRNVPLPWLKDLVFPSASHLAVEIPEFFDQTFDENIIFEEIRVYLLFQRIQMAMPKLQKVTLCSRDDYIKLQLSSNSPWKPGALLSIIIEKVTFFALSKDKASLQYNNMLMQDTIELTELDCWLTGQDDVFVHVVRKSASTLESLICTDNTLSSTRLFIFDEENEPVIYPRLRKLRFRSDDDSTISEKLSVNKNIVLFPVLKFLLWRSMYIFDDDALFRGNSNTLEYLEITTDIGIVDILQRYKTFDDGKYSRLSHISVDSFIDDDGAENDDIFARFGANLITPATINLTLLKKGLHGVNRILAETRYLDNIQVLYFSGYSGTLHELITLVKLLPNMTMLECPPGKIDFEADNTQFIVCIDDIYEESYPLSHRLRCWKFASVYRDEIDFPVETALAFAILCTNFTLAYTLLRYTSEFDRKIGKFIASRQNDKYVDKVRRLLRIVD